MVETHFSSDGYYSCVASSIYEASQATYSTVFLRGPSEQVFDQSISRTKEQKIRLQCLASAMPKSAMPSADENVKVSAERKRKNLAVLAEMPRLKRFFPAKLLSSNVQTVALTRPPENVAETHDISFEAPFTLRVAGHIDMLFFRCFCL